MHKKSVRDKQEKDKMSEENDEDQFTCTLMDYDVSLALEDIPDEQKLSRNDGDADLINIEDAQVKSALEVQHIVKILKSWSIEI